MGSCSCDNIDNHSQQQHRDKHDQGTKGRSRFIKRDVIAIASLSAASMCFIVLLIWACVARGDREHWGSDACGMRKNDLGFQGNGDFYGLGIRVGVYLQWFASLLANVFLTEEVRRMTTIPYIGFQIAVFVAFLFLVFTTECTFTAELFVILYILLGGVFIVLAPEIVQSLKQVQWWEENRPRYRVFHTFVWIIVGLLAPVSAWFWIRLAIGDARQPDFYPTPGGTSMFLFTHVQNEHMKIASNLMAVWSILIGLFAIEKVALAFLYKALGFEVKPILVMVLDVFCRALVLSFILFQTAMSRIIASCQQDETEPTKDYSDKPTHLRIEMAYEDVFSNLIFMGRPEVFTKLYASVLAITSTALSICAVELTLAWNHISGINTIASTGQIISLLVGFVTLVSVLWEMLKHAMAPLVVTKEAKQKSLDDRLGIHDVEAYMWQSV